MMTSPVDRCEPIKPGAFLIEWFVRLAGLSTIGFVILIFFFLLREGIPALFEVPLGNLFGTAWYPTFDYYGTIPLILGSFLVTLTAVVIALPLGIASAVFVREVAPNWVREVLKPLIEVLAGIPSVVIGFMGMLLIVPLVRQILNIPTGLTAFTGVILLAWMTLPTVVSVVEDVLDAVPRTYRDAGLALGMTRWQTIWRIVLPAGRSGILTALMLGIGRAIGETMTVMMVTGNAARMPNSLRAILMPVRTMTATIAAEMGEVAQGGTHYHVLFAVGILLFVVTFVINAAASVVVIKGGLRRGGRLMG